ncbi:hypothetical protein HUT19_20235 [Streptomyces sp. NA02950]|uniref:DUF6049 family protein n=1 Tax=Streptomyces sp. NA02950 TaxID=2742137 RepID=UPI00159230E7|nr:DUF6049 family protein [Streptomyces sp. NA02950]QKV93798.1 hypothetical protein HUT19_20235 [Streptomyces sp. NA02950]
MADAADHRGTTSARARRWLRRTAAFLAAVPVLAGGTQIPAAPAAHAASAEHTARTALTASAVLPESKVTRSRSVDVAITSMTPTSPKKGDTLTVGGTVTNGTRTAISGSHVGLRVGPALNGRNAIDNAARRTGYSEGADGSEIGGKYAQKIGKLAAGASRDFSLSIPVDKLSLGQDGVYQLGVALSGQTRDRPWQHVLGIQRTFLPWQTGPAKKKSQLTFLWPLISSTHVTPRTDNDEDRTPIFRDDRLVKELSPGGRLQQMVSLGKDLPITWVIDPDLLATVEAMTKNYEVETPGGGDDTAPGRGQAVAKQWLNDLQKAVADRQVIALPFADPDLASLAHRGKNSGALGHLQDATELASTTVQTVLGVKPRTDFAWPVDGAVDSSVVDVATSAGAHNVIARSDSLRETGGLSYTPTAARQIGGGNTAVVADARLSTAFTGDMSTPQNSTLAIQRFLAQSQMINLQAPDKQRSVVVAPQRIPTTSQAQSMAAALKGLSGQWSEPLGLGQAAKAEPDPNATQRVPGGRAYPRALRKQELPTDAFEDIQTTQGKLDMFERILTAKYRVVTPFGNAIRREMSTSWRGEAHHSAGFRRDVQGYLSGLTKKVRLVPKSNMTLSGRSATIPVTVQNNLVQGVELRLVLRSQQGNRLEIGEPQVVTVEGGHSQSVKFGTTANANGPVRVSAQLYTPDGQPYGGEMKFKVNVTEITSTVILVIAGGVLLLVLAGIRIYVQRKRSAAEVDDGGDEAVDEALDEDSDTEDAAAGSEAAETDECDPSHALVPEQPSDPAPDTGSQSAGPSGSGEKVEH